MNAISKTAEAYRAYCVQGDLVDRLKGPLANLGSRGDWASPEFRRLRAEYVTEMSKLGGLYADYLATLH